MSKTIYAHTPPYTNETVEFERYTNGVSMQEVGEIGVVDCKFNEGNLIQEFKEYIDSTYDAHYCTSGIQSSEVIIDRGRGMGFFLGNVDKYNARYGNKGDIDDHRKEDNNGIKLLNKDEERGIDLSTSPFKEGDIFVLESSDEEHTYLKRIWTGSSVG